MSEEAEKQDRKNKARGIRIYKSHPGLYYSITILALVSTGLALNFFFYTPTFNPYGIDKNVIGSIFLTLGILKLIFLNIFRNLKIVRLLMATAVGFIFFWGISNTQQAFQGRASFQLPIILIGLALLQAVWVIEPSINPLSRRK